MVGKLENRSSHVDAQIISMIQFHLPQIDNFNFFLSNYSKSNNMSKFV